MANLNRHGYVLNRPATSAALALEESMYSCVGDLTPFWAVIELCDCSRCIDLVWQGRKLPADGSCLALKEHDEIRYNRSLRWELVAEWEAEESYNEWRYHGQYVADAEYDRLVEAAEAKEDMIGDFLEGVWLAGGPKRVAGARVWLMAA